MSRWPKVEEDDSDVDAGVLDLISLALAKASTAWEVRDGRTSKFWTDPWIEGKAIPELAPLVFSLVSRRHRRDRTVAEGLLGRAWVRNIAGALGPAALLQYVDLWRMLQNATLTDRCWTADRLARRGLPHNDGCVLCDQTTEDMHHLFTACPFSRQIWHEEGESSMSIFKEDGAREVERWEGYVDWRSRPAVKGRHGGMVAASFVLVAEVLENLAFLANASNLVTYLMKSMHYSPAQSATTVTNFMGTAFLLGLFGGFLSDAVCTTYAVYLISAFVEFMGLVVLTIQARSPSLMPPECTKAAGALPCEPVSGGKKAMLFVGLYLTALGIGGIKGSLPSHGAEQFDEHTPRGRKGRSTFFNYYVFCLSCGALIAVTFAVWVEDNKGWQWGFGISTIAILLSIPVFAAGSKFYRSKVPTGSPLVTIGKVLLAAASARRGGTQSASNGAVIDRAPSPTGSTDMKEYCKPGSTCAADEVTEPSQELSGLNRAVQCQPRHRTLACTVQEVEDVKIVLMVLPIFLSTIMLNCCLAQLSTFSVEQAATMNTHVGGLKCGGVGLPRMRSLATSLSWASLALGYYLSSVLVTVGNSATGGGGHRAWLEGASLNHYHLERFYWLMCVLSALNYVFFLVLAIRYKYRNAGVIKG
uniref:Reverse transcriptase zinc-binding domain-containing protein n=1 Tax=Aegilops tauschii TaxID=37682 RepID=M8C3S2_AEGTA